MPSWDSSELVIERSLDSIESAAWTARVTLAEELNQESMQVDLNVPNSRVPLKGQTKSLKRCFKEFTIPAVLRQIVPVVTYESEVIFIPGVYTDRERIISVEFDFKRFVPPGEKSIAPLLSVLGRG